MPTFYAIRSDGILSLQHIRNCLVHRAGIVGKEDIKNGDLELIWYAIRNTYKRSADKKLIIDSRYDKCPRNFKLGETIKLSPRELHQVAAYLLGEVFTICNAMNQKYKIYTKPIIFNQDAN